MLWVRRAWWTRTGFAVFSGVVLLWIGAAVVQMDLSHQITTTQVMGAALIFWILGMFAFTAARIRLPASELVIDDTGVHLLRDNGNDDLRRWKDTKLLARGLRTEGVRDSVSHGQPRFSVYGRTGALSATFIPRAAFDELIRVGEAHGFERTDRPGRRPGWALWQLVQK